MLLEIKNLKVYIPTRNGIVKAVDDVTVDLEEGESLGILGESGCGKTTLAYAILGLVPNKQIVGDSSIAFKGEDLLSKSQEERRKLRGTEMSFILQDPITALNPVISVGTQVGEVLTAHGVATSRAAWKQGVDMMRKVGIPAPEKVAKQFPHEFSGGMRQRAVIAMALLNNPSLLIVDEATTYLDVTIQAQVLELMRRLRGELGTTIIYITHDLGIIAEMCNKVLVMYAGQPVEYAEVKELYKNPTHPYTQGLFSSYVRLDQGAERPHPLEGILPTPLNTPDVCLLHPRCEWVMDVCRQSRPPLRNLDSNHGVWCFHEEKNK